MHFGVTLFIPSSISTPNPIVRQTVDAALH